MLLSPRLATGAPYSRWGELASPFSLVVPPPLSRLAPFPARRAR
jgi:hypothetical protein